MKNRPEVSSVLKTPAARRDIPIPQPLRHTYITNLIHEGVDPKTVQYLAGHENSNVTMDIYAKVKYNKPWELASVVNQAFEPHDSEE